MSDNEKAQIAGLLQSIDRFAESGAGRMVIARYRAVVPYAERRALMHARELQDRGLLSIRTRRRLGLIEHIIERVAG